MHDTRIEDAAQPDFPAPKNAIESGRRADQSLCQAVGQLGWNLGNRCRARSFCLLLFFKKKINNNNNNNNNKSLLLRTRTRTRTRTHVSAFSFFSHRLSPHVRNRAPLPPASDYNYPSFLPSFLPCFNLFSLPLSSPLRESCPPSQGRETRRRKRNQAASQHMRWAIPPLETKKHTSATIISAALAFV